MTNKINKIITQRDHVLLDFYNQVDTPRILFTDFCALI